MKHSHVLSICILMMVQVFVGGGCSSTVIRSDRFSDRSLRPTPAIYSQANSLAEDLQPVASEAAESGPTADLRGVHPADPLSAVVAQGTHCTDGDCPTEACWPAIWPPTIWLPALPRIHCKGCLRWLGPLAYRSESEPQDADIEPPQSKFHPVPTQPVFSPRFGYGPPQPLVQGDGCPGHLQGPHLQGPGYLPTHGDVRPILPD